MRKKLPLLFGATFLAFAVAACEGPAGPAGPAGPEGPEGPTGPAGPAGADGMDALNTCSQCHASNPLIVAIERQYLNSAHGSGSTFERNTTPCAGCHTSQGFTAHFVEGNAIPDEVVNPAPINCRTCHQIHTTYTDADYALATTDTVDLMVGAATVDMGNTNGNLCANCHQAREPEPAPTLGGDPVTIPNAFWGFHHGPQSNVLWASGAYEFSGSRTIPDGPITHGTSEDAGCPGCHMQDPYGAQAGGHTWNMTYEYHGSTEEMVGKCQTCHSTLTSFDYSNIQTTVTGLLDQVAAELERLGIVTVDTTATPDAASLVVASGGTSYSADLAAAYANWQMMAEDRSLGIHNPPYVVAILTNTLETLQGM